MHEANPDPGLVRTLLRCYRTGWFPMGDPDTGEVRIYNPDERGVLPLETLHVPRTVEKMLRQKRFEFTTDADFAGVVFGCADADRRREPDEPSGDWITREVIGMHAALHEAGHAHSIEAWRRHPETGDRVLVGGLYGVAIGSAFFGESMFHQPRQRRGDGSRHPLDGSGASSAALVVLVRHLRTLGFTLFDTQMVTDHVARFGAQVITRERYLVLLRRAVQAESRWRGLNDAATG